MSDGCLHCYAETRANRYQHDVWGRTKPRMLRRDAYWLEPVKWNRLALYEGLPRRVFCASLADVFEDVSDGKPMIDAKSQVVPGRTVTGERARLFDLIAATPFLRWQLLTKRPENVADLVPKSWLDTWPHNVWLGVTVEHQEAAHERLPILNMLRVPTTFLSCEPLLGAVDLDYYVGPSHWKSTPQWVIIGGESGPGCRAMNLDHARDLAAQCGRFGIPVWFKQVGGTIRINGVPGGDRLDGRLIHEHPKSYAKELQHA